MKHLIAIAVTILLLSSCKKEMDLPINDGLHTSESFFSKVKAQLKDSLSANDYSSIDTTQLFKSKDAQSDGYFVRGAFQKKDIATDFILLKTDSLGSIRQGRIIHVSKAKNNRSMNNALFQGQFVINSLDKSHSVKRDVVNGRLKKHSNTTATMKAEAEEPAGEQELPEVVVTSYTCDGSYTGDWYWYDFFFDDYSYGTDGSYIYGYSGGGGGSSNNNSDNNDSTMVIEVELDDNPSIKVEDYVKCFSTVPDANATYQITLYADIPVNGDPSVLFNTASGEVGHSFIELKKSSGGLSVQQNIGFYPVIGWKSLSNFPVDSKIVDNAGHEYNASLTTTLSNTQFQAALNEMQAIAGKDYEITSWNCTDFALDVFNAANTGETFTIPKYPVPGTSTYSNTPQGLYVTMQSMQSIGNDTYGIIEIPGVCGYVGASHGSCGD